jgi:tetratricopeptide (TPR) repeat protein
MIPSKLTLGLVSVCLCGVLSSPASALAGDGAATDKQRSEKAAELYKQANKLYDDRMLAPAEILYRRAWDLQKTYGIASNLGALELDLGKPAAAAEMLRYALQQFPSKGKPETRDALAARFDKAKKLACTLRVRVTSPGAEVLVDGKSAGTAPLADDLFVEAGNHTIVARQKDRLDAQQVIAAVAGTTQDVTLTPAPAPPKPVVVVTTPPAKLPIPGIVMAVTGAVGLGVGGAFIGLAEANRGDAQRQHDKLVLANVTCSAGSSDCSSLHTTTARADMFGNTGIGLLIGGGALAAAGAAYILWPNSQPSAKKQDTAVHATFGASPTGGGVTLVGTF